MMRDLPDSARRDAAHHLERVRHHEQSGNAAARDWHWRKYLLSLRCRPTNDNTCDMEAG